MEQLNQYFLNKTPGKIVVIYFFIATANELKITCTTVEKRKVLSTFQSMCDQPKALQELQMPGKAQMLHRIL